MKKLTKKTKTPKHISHFRGVVWNRTDGNPNLYRYVIVGMLVTDKPLENIKENEVILDGSTFGLSDIIDMISQKPAKLVLGTADDVLTSLDIIC